MSPSGSEAQADHTKHLEDAFTKALRSFFPKLKTDDIKSDFFAVYQKEAESYDREFAKKYDEDLNTTLIFAGLFSAVTTAFVIDVQTNLQPDYTQETVILLRVLLQKVNNSTFSDNDIPSQDFTPDPIIVDVQVLLYASLAASLLAAFLAVLGKQWLNRYARSKGGSAIEKCRDRQRKADGIKDWGFPIVMEVLPLMLQSALLLLGIALSRYLWTIDHIVAIVNIVVTSAGVLFYLTLIFLASSSYDCPYQTPVSLMLLHLMQLDQKHTKYLSRVAAWARKAPRVLLRWSKNATGLFTWVSARSVSQNRDVEVGTQRVLRSLTAVDDHVYSEPTLEGRELETQENITNASCITWILETSTDPDVIHSVIRFIPEVNWHRGIKTIPSLHILLDTFHGCLGANGVVVPASRDKAYACRKALIQLYIQQGRPAHLFRSLFPQHSNLVHRFDVRYPEDRDFDHTSLVLRYCCGNLNRSLFRQLPLSFSSVSHLSWFCHLLAHEVRNDGVNDLKLNDHECHSFLHACLSSHPPLPAPVIIQCVLLVALKFGLPLHIQDLSVVDNLKTSDLSGLLFFIFTDLSKKFQQPHYEGLVDALRVLSYLELPLDDDKSGHKAIRSLHAFLTQIVTSGTEDDASWKWECARFAVAIETKIWKHKYFDGDHVSSLVCYMEHEADVMERGELNGRGQSFADIMKMVRLTVASPWCSSELESYSGFLGRISSAMNQMLNGFSEHGRRTHWTGYISILDALLKHFPFDHLLIRDHGKALEEMSQSHENLTSPGGQTRFRQIVDDQIFGWNFTTLLRETDDREASLAWLRIAWKGYLPQIVSRSDQGAQPFDPDPEGPYSLRIPDGLDDFTAYIVREEDPSGMELVQILPQFVFWICWRTTNGWKEKFGDIAETYLKLSWTRPNPESHPDFNQTLWLTQEFYRWKGLEEMEPFVLHAWLKFVWTHRNEIDEGAKDATRELFAREDDPIVEEYRDLVRHVRLKLEELHDASSSSEDSQRSELDKKIASRRHVEALLDNIYQTLRPIIIISSEP